MSRENCNTLSQIDQQNLFKSIFSICFETGFGSALYRMHEFFYLSFFEKDSQPQFPTKAKQKEIQNQRLMEIERLSGSKSNEL